MRRPWHRPPAGAGRRGSTRDRLLNRLEQILHEQLSLAASEDFEAMSAPAGEIEELLSRLSEMPQPLSAEQAKKVSGMLSLHHRVGLVLAQKRDDLAGKLLHSARGKKTLRAYRQGTA